MRRSWRRVVAPDGIGLAAETSVWGAPPRPTVLALHATGFCKETLRPFIDELTGLLPAAEVVAFDQRAHGDSDVPSPPFDWWELGRDVLAVLEGRRNVVGVGHSAGGAAIVLAELLEPGTFRSMVLVEPIVFPGPYGRIDDHPLARGAIRRKEDFPDPETALANFAEKEAFAGWDRRALEGYVRGGLAPHRGGWRLKCPPWAEAEFYRAATEHAGWERLEEVGCPVTLVAGARSDSHPEEILASMAARLGGAVTDIVPNATHFVMMEWPGRIAEHTMHRATGSGQAHGPG